MNLIRVDDRLIHGQVSVGWGAHICPKHMIIANDEIAADANDSELYLLGVPPGVKGAVVPVAGVKEYMARAVKGSYILVIRSIGDAVRLLDGGFEYTALNIGGVHLTEGKREMIHYVFLDKNDIEGLVKLTEKGINIFFQDLPSNKKYGTEYILNKWKRDERES
jgi:mannose/fructose/N-acetylgalactosamine-specific phosphotransferase system component IIB